MDPIKLRVHYPPFIALHTTLHDEPVYSDSRRIAMVRDASYQSELDLGASSVVCSTDADCFCVKDARLDIMAMIQTPEQFEKWFYLTLLSGKPCHVNIEHVVWLRKDLRTNASVMFVRGSEESFTVQEPLVAIMREMGLSSSK